MDVFDTTQSDRQNTKNIGCNYHTYTTISPPTPWYLVKNGTIMDDHSLILARKINANEIEATDISVS